MKLVLEAEFGFTNPFNSSVEDNDCTFCLRVFLLSMPWVRNLREAREIRKQALEDFIDSILVESLSFTTPLNVTSLKLLQLARSRKH